MKTKISVLDKIAIVLFFILLVIALLCFTVNKFKAAANTAYVAVIPAKSIDPFKLN